jgi:hypothetical protein
MSGPWSRKQRAKFNATIDARKEEEEPPKKLGKKKPYRKPGRIKKPERPHIVASWRGHELTIRVIFIPQ